MTEELKKQKQETIDKVIKEILRVNPEKEFVCLETVYVNGVPEYNAIFEKKIKSLP